VQPAEDSQAGSDSWEAYGPSFASRFTPFVNHQTELSENATAGKETGSTSSGV